VSNADAYTRQVDMFSTAIEGNLEGPVPGEEGWQNQEALDAAYRSLKSGKAETVPLVEKKRWTRWRRTPLSKLSSAVIVRNEQTVDIPAGHQPTLCTSCKGCCSCFYRCPAKQLYGQAKCAKPSLNSGTGKDREAVWNRPKYSSARPSTVSSMELRRATVEPG
jgi:hypothetical protein